MARATPLTTQSLLLCVTAALAVSVFFYDTLPIYPFRLLVTLMHESGHAIAAILIGGHVASVTISPTQGGLTLSTYPQSIVRGMIVTSAGYVGSAISGAALLWAAGRMRTGRFLLTFLAVWMIAVAVLWVPIVPPQVAGAAAHASGYARSDGLFTLAFILVLSSLLLLVAWKGAVWLRQLLVIWIATLSCLAALQDIRGLFGYGLDGSDAASMARVTHLPAGLWAGVWMLLSLLAVALGLRSLLGRRDPRMAQGIRLRAA
jgi:hypothetical protein